MSPATVKKLDTGDYDDDNPLSNHLDYKPSDDDQEMAIVEKRPGMIVGDRETGPKETGTGKKDTGHNPGDPVDAQDPVLPSTSAQQLGPTRPGTGALASASVIGTNSVMAVGCGPVIPVLTFVLSGDIHWSGYTSGHYGDSVRDGYRILFYLGWAHTHLTKRWQALFSWYS